MSSYLMLGLIVLALGWTVWFYGFASCETLVKFSRIGDLPARCVVIHTIENSSTRP